jgi:hypothetical protein
VELTGVLFLGSRKLKISNKSIVSNAKMTTRNNRYNEIGLAVNKKMRRTLGITTKA